MRSLSSNNIRTTTLFPHAQTHFMHSVQCDNPFVRLHVNSDNFPICIRANKKKKKLDASPCTESIQRVEISHDSLVSI